MSAIQQGVLSSYAPAGGSAISLLAHTAINTTPTNPVTSAIDTSGASLLVVCVNCIFGNATVGDSKSNIWVALTAHAGLTVPTSQFFYCKNPTVGTLHTFTITAGNVAAGVLAFNHTNTGANADGDAGADANAASVQASVAVTPSQDNSVVVSMVGSANTSGQVSHTINGGFTLVDDLIGNAGSGFTGVATAYLIQTTAAAAQPTWTQTGGTLGGLSTSLTSFKHS